MGIPDDQKEAQTLIFNKTEPLWTASANKSLGIESYSYDIGLGIQEFVRYNNYMGFSKTNQLGINFKGMVSIGISTTNDETTLNYSISAPSMLSFGQNNFNKENSDNKKRKTIRMIKRKITRIRLKKRKRKIRDLVSLGMSLAIQLLLIIQAHME